MVAKLLLKIPYINTLRRKGYFAKNVRRQLFVNFIFQRIFGLNRKCKYSIHFTSTVQVPDNLKIGCNVEKSLLISGNCYIQATNGIYIGDNTIFAPGVRIISANHDVFCIEKHIQSDPVLIGANCWIGTNAVILPGVHLGDYTIVGAGSVVTKSFPQGKVIIAGNPAILIKELNGKI